MRNVYSAFLKENNFSQKLALWQKKYKNKKVIMYGCGLLFDEIVEKYDIKNKLNIIAVCDVKYESDKPDSYLGFETVKPSELKNIDYDVLIFTVFDHLTCLNYLNTFDFFDENKSYHHIDEVSLKNKIITFGRKLGVAKHYFKETNNLINTIKYIFSCSYTEYNSKYNYAKILKRVIEKVKRGEKIKILFIVESNQKWGWQSVYDEFKKDDRFEELLVTLPLTTRFKDRIYPQKEDIEFFSKLNMPIVDGFDYKKSYSKDLKEYNPDIIFYTHPWFVYANKIPPTLTSSYALTCAISYGFNVAESRVWSTTTPKNFCCNLWTMFAESVWHKSFYEQGTNLKNKDILYVTGYPKMDAYSQPVEKEINKLWKDDEHIKPRIIYAPHHSIERDGGFCASNFIEHSKFFLEFAQNHPEYEFLIKPHPVLKSKCVATGFMTEDEYEEYIEKWRNLPNGNAYTLGNYYDLFKTSDLLITDCFSFLGEYFVSGKPIVLLQNQARIPFNKFGDNLARGMYKPKTLDEIENLFKTVLLEKNDNLKEVRDKIIEQNFYLPEQGVANHIVSYIKEQINMK